LVGGGHWSLFLVVFMVSLSVVVVVVVAGCGLMVDRNYGVGIVVE